VVVQAAESDTPQGAVLRTQAVVVVAPLCLELAVSPAAVVVVVGAQRLSYLVLLLRHTASEIRDLGVPAVALELLDLVDLVDLEVVVGR
jgi:hypothetical protein